jgi:micrococcal nuclease
MYQYRAVCTRVIDGDTVELRVDLGFNIQHTIRGRLYNVHAPEIFSGNNKEQGFRVKEFLEKKLLGNQFLVNTYKDKMSFNRWIVELYSFHGTSINEEIQNFCNTLT